MFSRESHVCQCKFIISVAFHHHPALSQEPPLWLPTSLVPEWNHIRVVYFIEYLSDAETMTKIPPPSSTITLHRWSTVDERIIIIVSVVCGECHSVVSTEKSTVHQVKVRISRVSCHVDPIQTTLAVQIEIAVIHIDPLTQIIEQFESYLTFATPRPDIYSFQAQPKIVSVASKSWFICVPIHVKQRCLIDSLL